MTVPTPPAVSEAMREAVAWAVKNPLGVSQTVDVICNLFASEIARLTGEKKSAEEAGVFFEKEAWEQSCRAEAAEAERDECASLAGEALGQAMVLLAIHERWKDASVDESAARIITVICDECKEAARIAETRTEAAEAETARLRAEIIRIRNFAGSSILVPNDALDVVRAMTRGALARAALTSQEKTDA